MSLYNENQWKQFRLSVIELDDYKCQQCGREESEVVLQVHHKIYKPGLKAWEYPTSDCITLCKGCHAQTHGIIQPTFGWEYMGYQDLGDLIGTCENRGCNSDIRHSFTIFHRQWGTLEVGTVCCDNLTDSEVASNLKESKIKYESRKQRFLSSKRWNNNEQIHTIKQGPFEIEIFETEDNHYSLKISGKISKIKHKTLTIAKSKVFEIIENGQLIEFFRTRNLEFDKKKNKRQKKS